MYGFLYVKKKSVTVRFLDRAKQNGKGGLARGWTHQAGEWAVLEQSGHIS